MVLNEDFYQLSMFIEIMKQETNHLKFLNHEAVNHGPKQFNG